MDFNIVAHDLRTPLNAMLGHTQLLAVEQLSAAGRRRLEIIETQIRRMATLIDSCTRSSSCPTRVALVDLNVTLRSVIAEAHGGRIELTSEPGEGTIVYLSLPIGGGIA
jgi:signal transduction histidine kinase